MQKITTIQSVVVPYFFVAIVMFGTMITPLNQGLFVWMFIVPTLFYLLYGMRHGFWAALIIGMTQLAIILLKEGSELYNTGVISANFALAYISVWVVSHVYENHRQTSQKKLKSLAMKDFLTGCNNRLALKEAVQQKSKTHTFSLALIDIDGFKRINDDIGHEAGDAVLVSFVSLMQSQFNPKQVYRLAGEEFALLLDEELEVAKQSVDAFRQRVEIERFMYENRIISITVSVGLSDSRVSAEMSDLLADADRKLYKAKHQGKNCIVTA